MTLWHHRALGQDAPMLHVVEQADLVTSCAGPQEGVLYQIEKDRLGVPRIETLSQFIHTMKVHKLL